MDRTIFSGSYKDLCEKLNLQDFESMSTASIVEKIDQARDAGEQAVLELYQLGLLRNLLHVMLTILTREYKKWAMEECTVVITREDIVNPLHINYIDAERQMGYMIKISIPVQDSKSKQIIIPL